jgi:pyruvate formate lyase activating enzyme
MAASETSDGVHQKNSISLDCDHISPQRAALKGAIFKIERLAVHDGPGIRTLIFFKGCPLRCLWCSSPESQSNHLEIAYDERNCVRCMMCLEVCPLNAIYISKGGRVRTDRQRCDNCGECVNVCRHNARRIIGQEVYLSEVIKEIERDEVFYYRSGGGVTLSGGEPTAQPEFAKAILKSCLNRGIPTAMETCGYTCWGILEDLLDFLDLIYVDLKHISAHIHEKLTGVSNHLILENIEKMNEDSRGTPMIIRLPVIPGINDTQENIRGMADFVRRLNNVKRIDLLPYHRYGVSSYWILERDYELTNVVVPSHERMLNLKSIFESHGITVQIGG